MDLTNFNDTQDEQLLVQALYNPAGLRAIGSQMQAPIQTSLLYQGIARKLLVVDPIAQGALARYAKDVDVAAVTMSDRAQVPSWIIEGADFLVPTFTISTYPQISYEQVQQTPFNLIDRVQVKAKNAMVVQEDTQVFLQIDASVPTSPTNPIFNHLIASGSNHLTLDLLNAASAKIEKHRLISSKIIMNSTRFSDIRVWGKDYFDFVTQREVLLSGVFGKIWDKDILISNLVPDNDVLIVADAPFLGFMPVRQEITVIPADIPGRLRLGWVVFENIGLCIANPKGVAKISL